MEDPTPRRPFAVKGPPGNTVTTMTRRMVQGSGFSGLGFRDLGFRFPKQIKVAVCRIYKVDALEFMASSFQGLCSQDVSRPTKKEYTAM